MWVGRTGGVKNGGQGGIPGDSGFGGSGYGASGRTSGGTDGSQGSGTAGTAGTAALIEVVFGNWLGVGGIEPGGPGDSLTTERVSRRLAGAQRRQLGGLVEVVGERFLGGLVFSPTVGLHGELGLRWSPGRMEERG